MKRAMWNPWHGCHRCSPGCKNCYVYYFDEKRKKDTNVISKSKTNFNLPLKKSRKGEFKIEDGCEVATCFTSDFFLEEADLWRDEAWEIIKKRPLVKFLIPTKRIERFNKCLPSDWGEGYDNVIIAISCENQEKAEERLKIFQNVKAKHKYIFASPLLEKIDFSEFLTSGEFEMVSVGGESYENARPCDFEWVKYIKKTCDKYKVRFDFHQTGSNFVLNGKGYKIKHFQEYEQAKKAMKYIDID